MVHAKTTNIAAITQTKNTQSLVGILLSNINSAYTDLPTIDEIMNGKTVKNEIGERNPPSPKNGALVGYLQLGDTYGLTGNHLKAFNRAKNQLQSVKTNLEKLVEGTIPTLEAALKAAGAPWIEGKVLIKH